MKHLLALLVLTAGFTAQAIELGETAPCVVLEHYQTNGQSAEHCIRDKRETQTHTLIEFFSITCSACKENLPRITAVAAQVENVATTRLVSIDRNIEQVRNYISANRQNYPFEVAFDFERDAKRAYDVTSTPTLFVLDQNNAVVFKHEGVLSNADMNEIVKIVKGQ